MKKIVRSKNNWLRASQIVTAFVMGSMLLTTVHAKPDRNTGVITLEVEKIDGMCRVLIQSEKSISNVILNLGDDQEKIEYLYEQDEFGNMISSPIGHTYDLGEYVAGSELDEIYGSIHVKAGNNGKRGVGEELDLNMVDVAEECEAIPYVIGGKGPSGGWVFEVSADGTSGKEAGKVDVVLGSENLFEWGCRGTNILAIEDLDFNFLNTDDNLGEHNTQAIINVPCDTSFPAGGTTAAQAARNYEWPEDGMTGGYLPNREELNAMYENIGPGCDVLMNLACMNVDGFANDVYWSSSEFSNLDAWYQIFVNGGQSANFKDSAFRVRAVRAFNNSSL